MAFLKTYKIAGKCSLYEPIGRQTYDTFVLLKRISEDFTNTLRGLETQLTRPPDKFRGTSNSLLDDRLGGHGTKFQYFTKLNYYACEICK